jgi:hypothetical protein
MTELTKSDYIKILDFYNEPIPKLTNKPNKDIKKKLRRKTEKILASKLCRCIKKIDSKYEARSIGICTKTVFNNKGLTRRNFKCKGNPSVTFNKMKGGQKNNNCKTKCKNKFIKELQQDSRYKALNKIASFFGKKKYLDTELNNVLDNKDIQNDEAFKDCVKKCK